MGEASEKVPQPVYERLRDQAKQRDRSRSSEVVMLLERALLSQPWDTEALIAEAEAFHARFDTPLPDLVAEGKRAGRQHDQIPPSTLT